jgi:colicin import membrane protein
MPSAQSTALEVVAELPLSPILVIPSDTLALVDRFRHAVSSLAITSADRAEEAACLLRQIADTANALEARRKEVKQPFLDAERKIDAAVKAPAATLDAARTGLRGKLAAWQAEQDRIARENERRRQEELARLERERREAEERARAAQAAASTAETLDEFGADEIAAEQQAATIAQRTAALAIARVELPAKPAGITYRTTLKAEVVDVKLLPSHLVTVTANEAAIRAQFCTGYKEGQPVPVQPGIRFTVEKLPVISSRR